MKIKKNRGQINGLQYGFAHISLLLGILLTIERVRRAYNNDNWFTPGFGLGLIFKIF